MTRILITGGTGFFGKSILDYFSRHSCLYDFTILSRHGFGDKSKSGVEVEQLTDSTVRLGLGTSAIIAHALFGDVRTFDVGPSHFDCVIHAATPARADIPDDEMRSIVLDGTAHAIEQAKRCGASKFMMVSSGGVYGGGFTRPISEDDAPHPFTAYGQAKLQAEQMAIDSGLYALIPRCFAFVGRHLDRNARFAIGNFIRDALAGKDIVVNGDGTPMRSFMYADDLVEWLFAILEHGTSGRPYNVGSPEAISIRDLAFLTRDTLHATGAVRVLGQPVPGAANHYVPNTDRARNELGLVPKIGLRQAILASCRNSAADSI